MKKNNFICTDIHTHIGQFEQTYYDYHDVFSALKNNGIVSTTFAYLTPLFTKSEPAIEFYKAVTEELKDALKYANQIGLEVNALYWIDPVVISGGISIESIMKEFNYQCVGVNLIFIDGVQNKDTTSYEFKGDKLCITYGSLADSIITRSYNRDSEPISRDVLSQSSINAVD